MYLSEQGNWVFDMDRRLYEASLQGNVTSLIQLLEEDAMILDRTMMSFSGNPLHIAAMRGHLEFTRVVLKHKSQLASKSDSQGFLPLHWASVSSNINNNNSNNEAVDLVRELVRAVPSTCLIGDFDGRTALHLAAMEGSAEIMKELFHWEPRAIQVVLHGGETILHLCVKHGNLEALKSLLQWVKSDQISSSGTVNINSKDDDGNTALHLAVAKKQIQFVELLLSNPEVEVNSLTHNGFTALDILSQSPRDLKDIQLGELLHAANALRARDLVPLSENHVTVKIHANTITGSAYQAPRQERQPSQMSDFVDHFEKHENWLERKRNTLMVVTSLLATMAFQGGVNPPGGSWQDDSQHIAGTSIMATKHPNDYVTYMALNTVGFLTSLTVTLLLISGVPLKRKFFIWVLILITWLSITSMVISYQIAILAISHSDQDKDSSSLDFLRYGIVGWVGLLCYISLVHLVRFVIWLVMMVFRMISWLCKKICCR